MPTPSPSQRCVSIIFNPVSGKEDPEKRQQVIRTSLAERGCECVFFATTKEVGAGEVARQALKEGGDVLMVSGGDGTVVEVLAAAVGTAVPVAILPAGTGNLLAINLGIPTKIPQAVEVALSGTPRNIDLARTDTGRYFAIMGGLGMDAQLIHDADREAKNRLGVWAYVRAAWLSRFRRRTWMDISLDDRPALRRKVKTVLIANMGKITGGLPAVPTADPTNGSLEVSIVTVKSTWHWVRLLTYMVRGKAQEDPLVEVHRVSKVSIRCEEAERAQFDGEDGGVMRNLAVEAVPEAVTVMV